VTHLAYLAFPAPFYYDQRFGIGSLAVVLFVVLITARPSLSRSAPA
jgi:hypothetical protein